MNIQAPRPSGSQPWEEVRTRLDQNAPFSSMIDTPYYRDAVYDHFSKQEYARRYQSLRDKMREHKLDCVIVPGGPSHWSFGGGMQWLTGHWEWHAISSYVLVPLDGEPTLVFSMGGTHAEACRRECANALTDVRHSRSGKYAEVMVERLKELKLERGRIGLVEIDARHNDYLPVNQYNVLRNSLPDAELVFTKGFLHELVVVHSEEELRCVRKAGVLCERAMEAMIARAKPGVPEYELRAAAGAAILDGGGDIDFLIIGTTPMANPAMVFGNPRPSHRKLQKGDIRQHGAGRRLQRSLRADRFADHAWSSDRHGAQVLGRDHLARLQEDHRRDQARQRDRQHAARQPLLPRARRAVAPDAGARHRYRHRQAARLCRTHRGRRDRQGAQARHDHHGRAQSDHADGMFGIFLGHTFIVTKDGYECVDNFRSRSRWPRADAATVSKLVR
jgi:Xaa-Pro aminopeptidase